MAVIDRLDRPGRKYAAVLADPPWPYNDASRRRHPNHRGAAPYDLMSVEDIMLLPLHAVVADDAELWLWATNPHIHSALHVIEAWGFTYRSMRTWVKPHWGTGYWLRSQTEHLLFATRGDIPVRGTVRGELATVISTRDPLPHSRKPRQVYEDIERVSGTPRIELFARRARAGWDAWGLEAVDLDRAFAADQRRGLAP